MSSQVYVEASRCNLSYACIRVCPAKAIRIADSHAQVMPGRCIECGHCIAVCNQNAIRFCSSKMQVTNLLASGKRVAAICDPSISGEFVDITDFRKFVAMIRALGFNYVTESAFAVDLLARKYRDLFLHSEGKYYISTKCPPLIRFVDQFTPSLVDNLAPFCSPVVAMAKILRKRYGEEVRVVYLTSCIAANSDNAQFKGTLGELDAVLTFVELRQMFSDKGITENSVAFSEFDPPTGRKGGLFPIAHGLMQSADLTQSLLDDGILITEGRNNFLEALQEFHLNVGLHQHLDLFYCNGCHMGPGMSAGGRKFARRSQVIQYVRKRMASFDEARWQSDMDEFWSLDLSRTFTVNDLRLATPSEEEVDRVLQEMGKSSVKDRMGCGSCGYSSCKEFAVAYIQGLTQFEMCYAYTNKKLHTYIDKLNSANQQLTKAGEEVQLSEEKARMGEEKAREAASTTSAMLHKLRAGIVIVDKDLRVVETNNAFVKMLGDEAIQLNEVVPGLKGAHLDALVPFHKLFSTVLDSGQDELKRDTPFQNSILHVSVFTIRPNEMVGGILRDLTEPEFRKEEVTSRARQVIYENLATVQQIAFLLGESASKTEKILNSIIEAQKLGDKSSDESEQ